MLKELFSYVVQSAGSQISAIVLLAGLAIGFLLIVGSIINPDRRSVRWLKAFALIGLILSVLGAWGIKDPELVRVRAAAAEVPSLEKETSALALRVKELEVSNSSLIVQQRILEAQVGQEKSKAAEALTTLERELKALADSLGEFDRTKDGVERLTLPGDLLFEPESTDLGCDQREALSRLVGFLLVQAKLPFKNKLKEIVVVGNTDNTPIGRPDRVQHNQILSEARANAVADYLVKHGVTIPVTRIGKGMMVPKGSQNDGKGLSLAKIDEMNATDKARRTNRRVELLLIHPQDTVPTQ